MPTIIDATGTTVVLGTTGLGILTAQNVFAAVNITSLPSLPAGANTIGAVTLGAALPAGNNLIGSVNFAIGGAAISATNPVPTFSAYTAPQVAAWQSTTAVNAANTVNTQGYGGVMISVTTPSTITGGGLAFEGYDGTAWIPVQAGKMNAYGGQTAVALTASMTQAWQINTAGLSQFRTRLSSAITGTGNVVVTHQLSAAAMPDPVTVGLDPSQPLPAGSNVIGITKGFGDIAATSTPITATINDTAAHTVGPFTPQLSRPIWLTLNATVNASGTAQLLRSTDGGTTWLNVTRNGAQIGQFTFASQLGALVNESILTETDAAAIYQVQVQLSTGTVSVRLAQ